MATFPILAELNQFTTNQIVELLNVRRIYEEIKKELPLEYWLDCNYVLEALDLSTDLSEMNLPKAPFPAIDITDTQADRAVRMAEIWSMYPKIGLQLHVSKDGSRWVKKGQPIVIQNTPVQLPLPVISPYLNVTAPVYLMGKDSKLGISIINSSGWQRIKGSDLITVTGSLRVDLKTKEIQSVPIRHWVSVSKVIPANTPTKVLVNKPNRRFLTLVNGGNNSLFCGFGNDVGLNKGNLLTPGGSYNLDSQKYYTESEFWAFSPENDGLIVGQEGLI